MDTVAAGTGDADAALSFLDAADAEHLRRLVGESFARAGVDVVVHADHVQSTDGTAYGLWNLAATCHESGPRDVWPDVVEAHVALVLDPPPSPEGLSADELLDLTVLRVVATDQLPEDYRETLRYATPVADGLLQVLVADFPTTVTTLGDAEVERVGLERLLEVGRARLLAEPVGLEVIELDGGVRLEMLAGESVHVASKVLVLADVLRSLHGEREYPDGVLVAVPDRHSLMLHVPVDAGVVAALQSMTGGTAHLWASAAGGVSPSVYWWRDGTLTRVTALDPDGRLRIEVHEDLGEVLDRLAAA